MSDTAYLSDHQEIITGMRTIHVGAHEESAISTMPVAAVDGKVMNLHMNLTTMFNSTND